MISVDFEFLALFEYPDPSGFQEELVATWPTDIYLVDMRFIYNQRLPLSSFRPAGCSPCSRCEFQLWDICWDSGLAGNSTCRCDQNSHAALPNEISVDWPVSYAHFQSKALGNSPVVQWLGLRTFTAGDMGLIPGQ